jgi:hypothetical protein
MKGGGGGSPVSVSWAERPWWAGLLQLGGLSALWTEPGCTVLFIIFHFALVKYNIMQLSFFLET